KGHLKTKLVRVLSSSQAYPVQFNAQATSPVPEEVRQLTKPQKDKTLFVRSSQLLANHLFQQQVGSVSPGLLCVIDVVAKSLPGIVLMKLEREAGAQLELTGKKGERTFSMSVIGDLVLTEGTRLFKSAMFLRTGQGDDDLRMSACDSQWVGGSIRD